MFSCITMLSVCLSCHCLLAVMGYEKTNAYGQPKRESDVWGRGASGAAFVHGDGCMCIGCQEERNREWAEEDRLRRAAELRKAEVANRLLLELQQRGKEDKENDKPECEEVEEYVSANANGRFPRWNGWRQQRFHAIEGDLRRQWIERAQTSSQYNKEYLEKQRYDAYYEKWKQENRASHARAEVKRTHEVTEKKSSVRNSQKKKLVPGESIGGGFEIKRSKHGAYGLFKGDEFTGFVSTEKEDCVEWAKKLAE